MSRPKLTVIVPAGKDSELFVQNSLKNQKVKVNVVVERGDFNASKNRNRGFKKVKTPYVAFVNAHSILPLDWSKKINTFFPSHKDIDIVGGPQLTPKGQNFFAASSGYALSSIFGAAEASARYKITKPKSSANEKYLTSSNLACKSNVLKKIRFDETLWPGEDPKFIEDAKNAGFNVYFEPKIYIYNKRREDMASFARQVFKYGIFRPKKESLSRTLRNPSFLIPSLFLVYLIFLTPLLLLNSIFIFPLILYLIMDVIFSIYESARNTNIFAVIPLLIIFPAIHISYGLGFIIGIIKYQIFGKK